MTTTWLQPGEPAPWFRVPALGGNPAFAFDTVAGHCVMLLFFGSAARRDAQDALRRVMAERAIFDDRAACFFGVTIDPSDAEQGRIAPVLPGIRFFLDYDGAVSRAYRAVSPPDVHPCWVLLDSMLRVRASYPLADADAAFASLRAAVADEAAHEGAAPVLTVPNVFEPELCRTLIDLYARNGGKDSGFMRDVNGATTGLIDHSMKQRFDCEIDDADLQSTLIARISRRLRPMVRRAFQFDATRIERHIVACYQGGSGHFRPHRDNTTKGTAHRRFAVTINLNAGDYEGGDLRFPEFGTRTYRAPTGGAVVFSCSLLHEATPVTAGTRYAYLPFLYDEAGHKVRQQNLRFLADQDAKAAE